MRKYQIEAQQKWPPFQYQGKTYGLDHLNVHTVKFNGDTESFEFVVTYGLHCFAKEKEGMTERDIEELSYKDGREDRPFDFKRYELSKMLPQIISTLHERHILEIGGSGEKFRTIEILNEESGLIEEYKVGFHCFKEKRLLRIHVTTAFLEERDVKPGKHKRCSIFKIALDVRKKPRSSGVPKEAKNRVA